MTRFFDGLLGSILSIIQGVILVYLALSMIFVPFIKDSKKTIQESRVASFYYGNHAGLLFIVY